MTDTRLRSDSFLPGPNRRLLRWFVALLVVAVSATVYGPALGDLFPHTISKVAGPTSGPGQRWGDAAGEPHEITDGKGNTAKAKSLQAAYPPIQGQPDPRAKSNNARVQAPAPRSVRGFDAATSRELADRRGRNERTFANTDGTETTEFTKEPINYRSADGSWQPVDTTLVSAKNGGWRNRADQVGVTMGPVAVENDLVRLEIDRDHTVGFGVADANKVAGTVTGNTATYPGVRPESDLVLEVQSGLVKENLVLRSAKAPHSWIFPLTMTGLTAVMVDGQVVLRDDTGKVRGRIPAGYMVDASEKDEHTGEPPTSYGVTYQLVQHGGKPALRMDLDSKWLNAPGRVYPVTVDPPVDLRDAASSMYVQRNSDGQNFSRVDGDLKVGHSTDSGGNYTAASYISFPGVETALQNHRIFGAQLALTNYHSWSCGARPVTVHPVLEPWQASNQHRFPGPAVGDAVGNASFAHGYIPHGSSKSPCPTATEPIGLGDAGRDLVQRWVNGQQPNYGLSVRASESDVFGWKKFTGAGTANPPRLAVTHTPYDATYKFITAVPEPPVTRTQGGKVKIEVTNLGAETWVPGRYALAYRYFTAGGQYLGWSESADLPFEVGRGGIVTLDANIWPIEPGDYRFEFTMIKRGVAFFTDEQIPPAVLAFEVIDVPPVVKEQYPPNGYSAPSLTPSLWARGLDVDAPPDSSLQYRFEICDKNELNCFDSGYQDDPTWTVPFGRLAWSKTYKWRVFAYDGTSESPKVPFSTMLTAVPQPEITSNVGNAPYNGSTSDFNPQVGNFTTSAIDASVGSIGPELNVVRTYNSLDPRGDNAFGAGWSTRYDMRIVPDSDGSGNVVVTYPDGQQVRYGANLDANGNPNGGRLIPPPGRYATLAPVPGGGWTLLDKNATLHVFRADGKLIQVSDNAQRAVNLNYGTDGRLSTVVNQASGRKLTFMWSGNHVATVNTDPVNGSALVWTYSYDGDRLTSVCDPNNGCTRYTYAAGSHYRSAVLDSKPDSYWRFGERAGTTAVSEIAVNLGTDKAEYRNLTLGAPGALSVTDNTAATFNGQSSLAVLPAGLVKKTRELSVEMWFKTTAGGPLFGAQSKPYDQNDTNAVPMLYVGSDGKLRGQFWTGTVQPITTASKVNDGQWHHVVLSSSLVAQTLYLDGQQAGTLQGTIDDTAFTHSQIGAAQTGTRSWPALAGTRSSFNGTIDEVAVYQHSLGLPAVRSHVQARAGGNQATSVKLPTGRTTAQVKYDASNGRLREYIDRDGGTWKVEFPTVSGTTDNIVRTVRVADPANRPHYYDYDPVRGRILRYLAPLGMDTRPEDRPPTPTTPPPPPVCTTPPPGEPVFCDVPVDGGPGSFPPVDVQGARTYEYDDNGFQSTIFDENGNGVTLIHDERGNVRSRKTCRTGPTDCQTTYFDYYATSNLTDPRLDKVIAARDARSANATDKAYRTGYTYTTRGDLETQTTADGAVVRHTYTEDRDPAFDGGSAPNGLVKTSTDPRGAVTRYAYYRSGDLAEITSPSGLITRFTYDAIGRRISSTQISDAHPAGVTTTYEYDKLSRASAVTAPSTTNAVTGVKHTLRATTAYDADGRPERVEAIDTTGGDPTRVSTMVYDDRGRLTRVTNAEGHETSFGYDVFGNRTWLVNAAGVKYEYAYTARNKLAEVRLRGWNGDPDQAPPGPKDYLVVQSYAYDLAGQLVRETDAMGRTTRYRYYSDGLLRQAIATDVRNPDGTKRDIVLDDRVYDPAGHITRATTAGGRVTAFEYDAVGRTTATIADPGSLARRSTFAYDRNGNVTQVARTGNESNTGAFNDASAEIVDYGYDDAGRLTSESVHIGADRLVTQRGYDQRGLITSVTDPRGTAEDADAAAYTTNLSYDELGRPVAITAPPVQVEEPGTSPTTSRPVTITGQDTFGGTTTVKDPAGLVSTTNYDKLGRPIAATLPDYTPPGANQPIKATARTEYDGLGRIVASVDPRGATTRFTYDQLDRVVTRTDPNPDTPGEPGGTWQYTYTRVGEQLSVTDPSGARVESTYDDLGRRVTLSQLERKPGPGTFTTTFAYNDANDLLSTTTPSGATNRVAYDTVGAPITVTSAAGVVTQLGYDLAGRHVKTVDGLGRANRKNYDPAGRLRKQMDLTTSGESIRQSQFGYDRAGNLTTVTDPLQHTTRFSFDALDRPVQQIEPVSDTESITTSFGYGLAGNRTRFTNGRNNSTIYTTNTWGLPESVIEPSTPAHPNLPDRSWTASYDPAANPVTMTAPGGVQRSRTFDLLGRLTKETGTGGEAATIERRSTYDELSRLRTTDAPGGTNTFTYNDRGALLTTAGPSGDSTFDYDNDGNLTTRKDAAGTATYGYLNGRVNSIKDGLTSTPQVLSYDNAGAVAQVDFGNSRARTFTYDNLGRLKTDSLGVTANPTQAAKLTYDYDLANRLTTKATAGVAGAGANTYGYDYANRLTSWTDKGNTTTYKWDNAGNRIQTGNKTATYDERNRLTSDATSTYTYTARGTTTTKKTGANEEKFTFDAFDRLISQGAARYAYDGLDRMVDRGTTRVSYSGGGNDLASDGASRFSRGPSNELLALSSGADKRLTVSDQHGDIVGGFDPAGGLNTLADSASFDPFGAPVAVGGAKRSLGYQGDYTDPDTGHVNMTARWYNSASGTFTSRDDIALPSFPSTGTNRYTYGNGSPTNYSDPTGHKPGDDWCLCPPVNQPSWSLNDLWNWISKLWGNGASGGSDGNTGKGGGNNGAGPTPGGTNGSGPPRGGGGTGRCARSCSPRGITNTPPRPDPAIAARQNAREAARSNPAPIPRAMAQPYFGSTGKPPVSSAPDVPSERASDYQTPVTDVNHSYQQLQNALTVDNGTLLGTVKSSAAAPSEGVATFAGANTENCANGVNDRGRPCRIEGADGCRKVVLGETCYRVGPYNTVPVEMMERGVPWEEVKRNSHGCEQCATKLEDAFGLTSAILGKITGSDNFVECYDQGNVEACGWAALSVGPVGWLGKLGKLLRGGVDESAAAAAATGAGAAAAAAKESYLLGLSSRMGGLPEQLGLKTFMGYTPSKFPAAFEQAIKDGAHFTVNLDGMIPKGVDVKSQLTKIVEAGKMGPMYGNSTNWEMFKLHEAGKLRDVTFLHEGQQILNPFAS